MGIFRRQIDIFSQETGGNLHEMSNPVFLGGKKSMSSAENFTQSAER